MNKNNYKITVITVVYNDVNHIEQTILSVLRNIDNPNEYIIIDGGSNDGTLDIIKKYDDKISFWVSEQDKGIYDAMNKGANKANGEYLMFLNSGDCLTQDFRDLIKSHYFESLTNNNKSCAVIYGDVLLDYGDDSFKYLKAHILSFFYYKIPFCHQSSLILKVEFIKKQFDIKYKIAADFKLFRQLYFEKKTFEYISIPFVVYDLNGISSNNQIQLLKEYRSVIKEGKKVFFTWSAIFITNIKILKHVISTRRK